MSNTNFHNRVSSYGMPILGSGGFTIPLMGGNDAQVFFVNPAVGSDGNKGTTLNRPLATVSKALSLAVDKRGDVAQRRHRSYH